MHTFTYFYTCPDGQITVSLAAWEILHLEEGLEELRVYTDNKQYDIMLVFGYLGEFVYIRKTTLGFRQATCWILKTAGSIWKV